MNIFLVVLLGLAVGSFLNAVIYRLHVGVSFVKGRSYCPLCKHDLGFWDLIPVASFVFLKGKCRYCGKKISWQYPLVEIGTTLVFVALYAGFGLGEVFFVYLVYSIFLILLFVYDLRYYLILDKVSVPALVIALPLSYFVLKISIASLLIGMLIGGGFFLLQFVVSRGRWIGGGDIRLGVLMGAMLGYQQLLVALFGAYVIGSVVGTALIISKRKKWKSAVPFGTFLSVGAILAFFFGQAIIDLYKDLFLL